VKFGQPLPLAVALGPGWLFLPMPYSETTVLLHKRSGAWVFVTDEGLAFDERMSGLLATALSGAVQQGGGQYVIETTCEDGADTWSAVARRVVD
jgi:hypothetical protein